MPTIINYVPKRDKLGRFKNIKFKKLALRLIKFQLIALSVLANVWFLHHDYTVTCVAKIGGVTQNWNLGHFETRETCNNLISDRINNLAQK